MSDNIHIIITRSRHLSQSTNPIKIHTYSKHSNTILLSPHSKAQPSYLVCSRSCFYCLEYSAMDTLPSQLIFTSNIAANARQEPAHAPSNLLSTRRSKHPSASITSLKTSSPAIGNLLSPGFTSNYLEP
jgi:hypothetical protein